MDLDLAVAGLVTSLYFNYYICVCANISVLAQVLPTCFLSFPVTVPL